MNNIVITETRLAARLLQSGVLKYFNNGELKFYMTDICFAAKAMSINNDRAQAKMLADQGLLQIVSLDDKQMIEMEALYSKYKPQFRIKTISAIVFACHEKFTLISEDDLLRDIVKKDFGLSCHDKEWFVTTLIYEITSMGLPINTVLLKQLI